ncbi:WW domain-containing protein [Tanacetum coccineum]|uniref:WW domain-containing protein n=1 Tax=Tanacetum coccineum TaxID=301880 RepID=A0ABQ5GYU9_9ASTR
MVSFHASLLPTSTMIQDSYDHSSTKRKRDGSVLQQEGFLDDHDHFSKTKYSKISVLDTELHLETPMPLEWQRCLDIKSGQIYYYNTKTQIKTSMDPRRSSPEPPKNNNMSLDLDLELNLPCGSSSSNTSKKQHKVADNFSKMKSLSATTSSTKNVGGGALSWLALDGGDQQQEMMTAVCLHFEKEEIISYV